MICSISASICKRFMLHKPTAQKITTFRGYSSLTPECAALLKPRGSKLAAIISTLNAKNFVCRLSWSISSHFGAIHS